MTAEIKTETEYLLTIMLPDEEGLRQGLFVGETLDAAWDALAEVIRIFEVASVREPTPTHGAVAEGKFLVEGGTWEGFEDGAWVGSWAIFPKKEGEEL
jgi:hypothetical protein